MRSWWKTMWSAVRDSLWFLPAAMTLTAAALAVALMAAERQGLIPVGDQQWWLYQGDAQGARSVLSSITSSLITATGVIFSVTIVAVQLASSQYSPRVLRDFSADRGNQVVLGIFIGTFTYGILVLRTIRGASDGDQLVPRVAVTGAVVLLLVCVGALIYFINHVARELHVTALADRIALETMGNVRQLFPEHIGEAAEHPCPDPRESENESVTVCAAEGGYVQIVDEDNLFDLGQEAELVIAMKPKIGDYVLPGRPLASISLQRELREDLEQAIRKAFVLGPERTPEQDVEFGMIQISDIAIKALSPSLNDPTTAVRCIDRLSEILAKLGTREPPQAHRTRDGTVRFVASYTTFDAAVKVAYNDIRHFGSGIPLIAQHLLHVLSELCALVPEERREPLLQQARAVLRAAKRQIEDPDDLEDVDRAAEKLAPWLEKGNTPEAADESKWREG